MPITIEFNAGDSEQSFKEDSITLRTPDELFDYVAPGGDCEKMPAEVQEIQMVFMSPQHPNSMNPIADSRVTLQMGMVFLTGPLAMIAQTAQSILDKAGRGELSAAFLAVTGAGKQ